MAKGIGPAWALALAGMVLAGCMNANTGGGLFAKGGDGGTKAHAPAQVQVMSKGFTIAGPKGYCVDTGATRETADGAFAVLGSCAVISGNPHDAKPRRPAMLTASVIPADTPLDAAALDRMVAFFSTDAGRTALGRADDAGEVTVIDLAREDGLVLVHAEDGDRAGDVAGDYWRGVFDVAGQLVTVTVSGFREAPLDDKAGARLARGFVAAIRRANGDGAPVDGAPGATNARDGAGNRLSSFFNRLL